MSIWQNINRGLGSLDDRQRALLLAMAAGGAPNPRMQAPLTAASQGLLQSIEETANRKQREQEAAATAQARARELEVRAAEAAASREDTAEWRRQQTEARAESDRQAHDINLDRLEQARIAATAAQESAAALADQRRIQSEMAQARLDAIAALEKGKLTQEQFQRRMWALGAGANSGQGSGINAFLAGADGAMEATPGTAPSDAAALRAAMGSVGAGEDTPAAVVSPPPPARSEPMPSPGAAAAPAAVGAGLASAMRARPYGLGQGVFPSAGMRVLSDSAFRAPVAPKSSKGAAASREMWSLKNARREQIAQRYAQKIADLERRSEELTGVRKPLSAAKRDQLNRQMQEELKSVDYMDMDELTGK